VAIPRAERRLAAILVADVVGYSRLMGHDEAGTLARLKAFRRELLEPLITKHRGRIVYRSTVLRHRSALTQPLASDRADRL
jgi:adenylate cyclase